MTPEIKQRIEQIRRGEVPEGYKKGKLGIVPEEWNETSFSTLFTSTSEYTDDLDKYPLYSLTIEDGVTPKTERYERSHLVKKEDSYKIVRPNDYAYNPMNLRFGSVARHKGNLPVAVSGYYDIFTTVHKSDLPFMDSFLTCGPMITYYNRVSTGSLVEKQRVHFSQFLEFVLPLPSINERAKIATILTTQDKVIKLKEKRLAEKQRQKKYLMHRFFVDANGKKIRLGQIANVIMGQSPSSTSYNEQMEGMPLIQGNGDIEGRNTHPRMYTTQPTKICKKGDILISVRAPVGSVSRSSMNACIGRGMCAVDAGIYQNYVYQYLIYFEDKWGKVSQGSTFESISGDEIRKLKTLIPDNMQHIEKILSTADREIELLQQDIEQEKQKKKALMQLLLTGIVRVKT